jgi:RNA polymerase sigma-70 factor (ECF subfamily)
MDVGKNADRGQRAAAEPVDKKDGLSDYHIHRQSGPAGPASEKPADAAGHGPAAGMSDQDRQRLFLDLLMPFYPKAKAYAQSITGSLIDGEDLLSDTVLRAYSRFEQLRHSDRFKEWFFSILLNRFRNLRGRQLLRPTALVADFTESQHFWEATARVSGDPAELGYQLTLVKELLAKLHPSERDALILLGPAGFEVAEVARIQGCSERAVIQRVYRARRKLHRIAPEGALPYLSARGAEVSRND